MAMDKRDFMNMCAKVPVKLPDNIQHQMWNMLSFTRGNQQITLDDFIAAWHIHDIEGSLDEKDPFIFRVSKVLKLEYYDMDIEEMQRRIRAKNSELATPVLDLENDDEEDDEDGDGVNDDAVDLPHHEGERRVQPNGRSGKASFKDTAEEDA